MLRSQISVKRERIGDSLIISGRVPRMVRIVRGFFILLILLAGKGQTLVTIKYSTQPVNQNTTLEIQVRTGNAGNPRFGLAVAAHPQTAGVLGYPRSV